MGTYQPFGVASAKNILCRTVLGLLAIPCQLWISANPSMIGDRPNRDPRNQVD